MGMRVQVEHERAIKSRAEQCLSILAAVSSVPRLIDFEQKVKSLLMQFFGVSYVRICFYDKDLRLLLTSSCRPFGGGGAKLQEARAQEAHSVVGRRNLIRNQCHEGVV